MMNSREWANARPTPSANAIRNYPMDWSPGWHISCHQQWKKWKVSPLELILYGFELYVKCTILKEVIIWFSEMLDGCRALLSIATIAPPMLFDKLLKSIRWNIKSSVLALCLFPFWLLKCILTIFCSLFIIYVVEDVSKIVVTVYLPQVLVHYLYNLAFNADTLTLLCFFFFFFSPFGTVSLLSAWTCEVVKANAANCNEEETWSSRALEILLDIWNVLLEVITVKSHPHLYVI